MDLRSQPRAFLSVMTFFSRPIPVAASGILRKRVELWDRGVLECGVGGLERAPEWSSSWRRVAQQRSQELIQKRPATRLNLYVCLRLAGPGTRLP